MMYLETVRDLVKGFGLVEDGHLYMGKLNAKKQESIGVYNSKHSRERKKVIGGISCETYGLKYVSFLVHWNKSARDTERAAVSLFEALDAVREKAVGDEVIKFIQLFTDEPVDVGTDDAGIFEMVIEAAVVYQKG